MSYGWDCLCRWYWDGFYSTVFVSFSFSFFLFPCAWVGPIDLLLYDLIVYRCRPSGGALPYLNVNAGRFDYKKQTKKGLFSVLKQVDPFGVELRRSDMLRKRGGYIVPGPNYIRSIDRQKKLRQYGIEIYGAIDTYSRYVPWIYIGVSAATTMSVATMYLEGLEVVPIQPQYLCPD